MEKTTKTSGEWLSDKRKMMADNSEDVTTTPVDLVVEQLRKEPICISPWKIVQFFENEKNISEEYLDKSLDKLLEIFPEFEENNREMVEELEKVALLTVPMFRKLQLMTILTMVREATSSSQVFPFLPDFPKPPASNLPNHIFRDKSMSSEEKKIGFENVAKNTSEVLGHLVSWRNDVVDYVDGLEKFLREYDGEMSQEQKDHVETLLGRTRKTIPQIDAKIEQKEIRSKQEGEEFEKFYRILSKESKYAGMDPKIARSQIEKIFDESDHDLRRIIVRIGGGSEEVATPTTGSDRGSETPDGSVFDEKISKNGVKRKRDKADVVGKIQTKNDSTPQNKRQRTILVEARAEKPINLATLTAEL